MFLALRELRRAKTRFGLLTAAVGLLVFLILTQAALQEGLIRSFVGAIEVQSAPVLVYAVDGQRTLEGSVITPDLQAAVEEVDTIGAIGRIGGGTFTASRDGGELSEMAVLGTDGQGVGAPDSLSSGREPAEPGEAIGSSEDFDVGDTVTLGPADGSEGPLLEIVGLVDGGQLQVAPTLFVDWDDYVAVSEAANPDATGVLPSALGVVPAEGVPEDELVADINAVSDDADALTRADAADETPGVAEVRQSFQVLFLLYGLVIPLVTGLFFLIVTFQKSAALTLLRAIGARASALVRSLLLQVLIVLAGGLAIGIAAYGAVTSVGLGTLTLQFDPASVLFWSALLVVLGLASALVAARRVLAIDPIEATSGGGGR